MGWIYGIAAVAAAPALTAQWWYPAVESLLGIDGDYEARLDKRRQQRKAPASQPYGCVDRPDNYPSNIN